MTGKPVDPEATGLRDPKPDDDFPPAGASIQDPLLAHIKPGADEEPSQEDLLKDRSRETDQAATGGPAAGRSSIDEARRKGPLGLLQLLGPGLITGASDDDPSGIGTYSQVGSQFGYGLLWTALFTFPLMAAMQELCARIALQTGVGLGTSLRRKFPTLLVGICILALFAANTINVGADLGAVAAGGSMLTRGVLPEIWLVVPVALLILALQFFATYASIFKIFKWLTPGSLRLRDNGLHRSPLPRSAALCQRGTALLVESGLHHRAGRHLRHHNLALPLLLAGILRGRRNARSRQPHGGVTTRREVI